MAWATCPPTLPTQKDKSAIPEWTFTLLRYLDDDDDVTGANHEKYRLFDDEDDDDDDDY